MENGKKSIEEIRDEVKKKIKENTEYTVLMNGKVQKFAFYALKENGRLCLLNTKYGTFTFMSAAYFIKHITTKKHLICEKPYNVEYPEGYEQVKVPSEGEILRKELERQIKLEEEESEKKLLKSCEDDKKWIMCLKTLPDHEAEILEKELKISPRLIAEDYERFIQLEGNLQHFEGRYGELANAFTEVKQLLKGTAWDVK